MEHGEPCVAVDVEGQSNLVSWCSSTGLLAVGCTPRPHNGAATVRIIPPRTPSVASTLHIPLEGPDDQLVALTFSTAAPPTGTSRPWLLLTATRSGHVCCWSQQAPSGQPQQPTTWDRWYCQVITPPAASSSSPDHPGVKVEVKAEAAVSAEGEGAPRSPPPGSSPGSNGEVVSTAWLHVKAPWAWNAAAGQQALDSYSSCSQHTPAAVTARLDAPFYQQLPAQAGPAAAAAAAAAGSAFSWLSRASLAFAVVYRSGKVRLYWSVLGRDSQLRWSSTALLQLPATSEAPQGDPAPAAFAGEMGPTAVAAGAGNVVLLATAPSSSSNSNSTDGLSTDLCLYQITGDPVYAAAAAVAAPAAGAAGAQAGRGQEGPMQPQLPVTLVTRHACPSDMRVTALAWCPAGAAQRLAVLLEPCSAVPSPSAPGAAGAAVMVQLLDLLDGQVSVAGQVMLRRRVPARGPLPNRSSSGSGKCVWSHDASWLSITTSQGTCVVLDAHQLLPLHHSWATGPAAAAAAAAAAASAAPGMGGGGQVSAMAPSPNSCMVAVLRSSTNAAGTGQPGTCLQLWVLLGAPPSPPGNSQHQQQQEAPGSRGSSPTGSSRGSRAEQLCAAAVGRCLWCLAQGTHTWDVTQLLMVLPRPAAAAVAPSTASPIPPGADLPAALSALDVAVMRHPQATRSVLSQRWDVLKLGVMQRVPGDDALRLAQELQLRLYILRVLRASMVLAEGAIMSWSRQRKVDSDRVNNEDVLAVHRWNQWFIRAIHLLLRVAKTWALAQQQQKQQQPSAAAGDADPAAAAAAGVRTGGVAGAGREVPLVRLLLDADLRAALFKVAGIARRILGATESWLGGSKSLPQGSDAYLKMWLVLTSEVQYREETAPSPAALAEAFPSPYQLHYHRPLAPAAALTERLEALNKLSNWAQPNGLPPISAGEVSELLQRWGLGWEVPPHVQAQYERQLQLHSSLRCGRGTSPSSARVADSSSRKRPAPPGGAWDPAAGEEEGDAVQAVAAAKRGRWKAALQLALGHPQACFVSQVRGTVNTNGTDPLSRATLGNALQKQAAAASAAAAAAVQGGAAPAAPQPQMLLALDGSVATTVGLGGAGGGGGGTTAGDKPRGTAVVQPQQVAWVGASPITGELWERRVV